VAGIRLDIWDLNFCRVKIVLFVATFRPALGSTRLSIHFGISFTKDKAASL
jgi:hypothetical protein